MAAWTCPVLLILFMNESMILLPTFHYSRYFQREVEVRRLKIESTCETCIKDEITNARSNKRDNQNRKNIFWKQRLKF